MIALTLIHDSSGRIGTDTSIQSGRVKLDVWAQTSSLSEMVSAISYVRV